MHWNIETEREDDGRCSPRAHDRKVFAFEPVAHNFSMLLATIHKAGLRNVTPLKVALSDRVGSREMVIPDSSISDHRLAKFAIEWQRGRQEWVQAETLDHLLEIGQISPPKFVKCDVEGASGEVIRGAGGIIRKHKPAWLIEIWYSSEFDLMSDLGYCAFAGSSRLVPASHFDPTTADYFFLPADRVDSFNT